MFCAVLSQAGGHARLVPCNGHGKVAPMLEDDLSPQNKKPRLRDLSSLSVDELAAYIEEMKAEIIRTEAEIKRKKASADAASLFFKKGE